MSDPRLSILHVDMDAFYTSIEERDDPTLAGLPVCVGGPSTGRGVIASASYAAREFGVHSAMPTSQAERLCPDLVLLPPDFDRYTEASRQIMTVFRRYTPLVEPLALDEAFLDVSGCDRLFGGAEEIGHSIRRDILKETGLVASVGVASSKFLAKLASDLEKPDGFCVIDPDRVREILDPLPVSKIFGVGPRTAKRLEAMGVTKIRDLASQDRAEVTARFGASGAWIHDLAHGIDVRRVTPRREEKSHGMERTFPDDVEDREFLRLKLLEFSEEVAYHLRDRGLRGRTVTIKARYWNFRTVTRTKTLTTATNLGSRIYGVAAELLDRVAPGPLRLLGVQISSLEDVRVPQQAQLFGTQGEEATTSGHDDERLQAAAASIDKLRKKYGERMVVPASLLGSAPSRGADGSDADGLGKAREAVAGER